MINEEKNQNNKLIAKVLYLINTGNLEHLKELIEDDGLDISFRFQEILNNAIRSKNTEIIKYISSKGACVEVVNYLNIKDIVNDDDEKIFNALLSPWIKLSFFKETTSLVTFASGAGAIKILKFLIDSGLKPNGLKEACNNGYVEIVKYLVSKNLKFNEDEELINAIRNDYVEIVKFIIENADNMKEQFNVINYKEKALYEAVYRGNIKITKYLIEKNANVHLMGNLIEIALKNVYGLTDEKMDNGLELIKLLFDSGVSIKIEKDKELYFAMQIDDLKIAKFFVDQCNVDSDIILMHAKKDSNVFNWAQNFKNAKELNDKLKNNLNIQTNKNKSKLKI